MSPKNIKKMQNRRTGRKEESSPLVPHGGEQATFSKIHEVSGEFSRTLAAIKPYRLRRHHLHASPPAPEP
jgi:hypothetical protein